MSATPAERKLAAQIAANMSWANTTDRSARTAKARASLNAKFLEAAGGDGVRAEHLRKAYFQRLSLKSAVARRKSREMAELAVAAEAELVELEGGDAA